MGLQRCTVDTACVSHIQEPGLIRHLKMPSVWSPLSASTSSESLVCTQGSCRSGYRSFCMLMTSCSALPNMDGLNTAFLACRISSTLGFFSPCEDSQALLSWSGPALLLLTPYPKDFLPNQSQGQSQNPGHQFTKGASC